MLCLSLSCAPWFLEAQANARMTSTEATPPSPEFMTIRWTILTSGGPEQWLFVSARRHA